MSADHYLAGPCEGMSIHRDGLTVTVRDKSGREPEYNLSFSTDEAARAAEWQIRDELYAKYEAMRAEHAPRGGKL